MKTKTLIIIIAVICLLFTAAATFLHYYEYPEERTESLDYAKLEKVYNATKNVAQINEKDVTWAEYSNYFIASAQQIEHYFAQLKEYYGMEASWQDIATDDGSKYIDIPQLTAESYLKQDYVLTKLADEYEAEYLPDDSQSVYNIIYAIYGEDAGNISDEEVIEYMEDNEYLHCMHILFKTSEDQYTVISDEVYAEREESAKQVSEELRAIEDKDERLARFIELCNEYNEDPGMSVEEGGYTFAEGVMVPVFYDGTAELDEYEVSEPIESSYGFHVIIRLPLDPDADISSSSGSETRLTVAMDKFSRLVSDELKNVTFNYRKEFEIPDVEKYIY